MRRIYRVSAEGLSFIWETVVMQSGWRNMRNLLPDCMMIVVYLAFLNPHALLVIELLFIIYSSNEMSMYESKTWARCNFLDETNW